MTFSSIRTIVYTYNSMAWISATGGYFGYARRGSKISLAAGLGFGALFFIAGQLVARGVDRSNLSLGLFIGTATSSLLAWRMGMRALKGGANPLFPATVAILSAATAAFSVMECKKRGFI